MCTHVYTHTYVYIHMCTYIHVHTYMYIHTCNITQTYMFLYDEINIMKNNGTL